MLFIQWKERIWQVVPIEGIRQQPDVIEWVDFDEGGKPEYKEKNPRSQIEIDWN